MTGPTPPGSAAWRCPPSRDSFSAIPPRPPGRRAGRSAARRDEAEYLLWRDRPAGGQSPRQDWPSGWAGSSRCSRERFCILTWEQVDLRPGPHPPAGPGQSPWAAASAACCEMSGTAARTPPRTRVLLTPATGKPMDLSRLSTVIRTALIRGGLGAAQLTGSEPPQPSGAASVRPCWLRPLPTRAL